MDKSNRSKGFTLIELLVAISIISIVSVIGLVSFQNVRKSAQDARIKADLNAIKKAYEANYDPTLNGGQGGYKSLSPANFANNQIPGPYTYAYGPDHSPTEKDGYKVTATLSDGTTASSTVISNQGTVSASQLNSCDPSGSLSTGLIGYWKLDGNANDWTGIYNASIAGSVPFVSSGNSAGNFNQAASFNGSSANYLNPSSNFSFASPAFSSGFTITAWVKTADLTSRKNIYNNGHGISYEIPGAGITVIFHNPSSWRYIVGGGITSNEWYLTVYTYNPISRVGTTYKNGIMVQSQTFPEAHDGGDDDRIGGTNPSFGNFPFNGLIDDFRIYKRPLTQSEISLLAGGCVLP